MNLVIVESPAKGKTIEKYLGKGWKVLASFGHVRDLPKHELGVDTENNYEPKYVIPSKAKKAITALKGAAKEAESIYLATDPDREGEAIAWHVAEAIGFGNSKSQNPKSKISIQRIVFHEITKSAIEEAVKHPRELDVDLIDAQQARRILDRLVGYTLSPFLWRKVMKGLSAGRVQSVAVRLIVEREREIAAFKPEEYWSVVASLLKRRGQFEAELATWQGEKLEKLSIKNQEQVDKIVEALKDAKYQITKVEQKQTTRNPYAPFTTSTLQQEAAKRLYFSAKQTMKLAQDLYEAGHITYMRTDSTNVATQAVEATRSYIASAIGGNYVPESSRMYKTKSKGAQEAHEAIRPTDPAKTPDSLSLTSNQHEKLYDLIWRRLVASQMKSATIDQLSVAIKAGDGTFRANGSQIKFDGFLRIWSTKMEERILPELKEGEEVDLKELVPAQHFTEPPPRYSEASLVKTLEKHGIGRPSTYAPTISTILDRGYVRLENRRFMPEQIGNVVTDLLVEHFPEVIDIGFTAQVEEDLDEIADGKKDWHRIIDDFWKPYNKKLEEKQGTVEKRDLTTATDEKCPECSKPLVIRLGRYGKFYACTGFPDCKYTKPLVESTGIKCPDCGKGDIVERSTRRGKKFFGCNQYPKCKYATWNDPRKQKDSTTTESSTE